MRRLAVAAGLLLIAAAAPASAQVARISVTTGGVPGNGHHYDPAVSGDGRFVAFDSTSSNLAPGDDDADPDVFLRDRDTDADGIFDEPGAVSTICVSATAPVATAWNRLPKITPDGRYVFFISAPKIFVPEAAAIWRLDRPAGTLRKVADGASLTGLYEVSADGDVVVIGRQVHEIAAGRVTTVPDAYVPEPGATLGYGAPSLSADGNRLAYVVPLIVNGSIQSQRVYMFDRPTATWTLIPVTEAIGAVIGASGKIS